MSSQSLRYYDRYLRPARDIPGDIEVENRAWLSLLMQSSADDLFRMLRDRQTAIDATPFRLLGQTVFELEPTAVVINSQSQPRAYGGRRYAWLELSGGTPCSPYFWLWQPQSQSEISRLLAPFQFDAAARDELMVFAQCFRGLREGTADWGGHFFADKCFGLSDLFDPRRPCKMS